MRYASFQRRFVSEALRFRYASLQIGLVGYVICKFGGGL